jgi:Family of unknown function (DUF7002)
MTPAAWIRLLNERVFFWLGEPAIARLLGGKEYRGRAHDVITLDTRALLRRSGGEAFLSPINSGATLYNPAPRGSTTFRPLTLYDTLEKRPPVELAIRGAVRDVPEVAVVVEERRGPERVRVVWERG